MSNLHRCFETADPFTNEQTDCPTQKQKDKASTATTSRSPSYLYRRKNILYFRYVFSSEQKKFFGTSEIRISLRTGFLREARKRVRIIFAKLQEFSLRKKAIPMSDLRQDLNNSLESQEKGASQEKPLSLAEIKQRMDVLRLRILDSGDLNFYEPASPIDLSTGDPIPLSSPSEYLDCTLRILQGVVNNKNFLESDHNQDILNSLLKNNIFENYELTDDNIPFIINEYLKMQISLNRIFKSRINGDYAYERNFIPNRLDKYNKHDIACNKQKHLAVDSCSIDIDASSYKITEKSCSHDILLSKLIEKYKNIKISDGDWTERNVTTHLGRLTPLLEILGDIAVSKITRADMREFRDKLKRLPPHRATKKEYKGKSIDEILSMNPLKTLSVKTVNDTLEAISSMFEWGIREEILEKNPAKALSLKDDREAVELRFPFTDDDLKIIFFSGSYKPDNFTKISYYWIPLIALYSGMRREEICQLYISDVYKEEGIWIFNVCESTLDGSDDKHLKSKNARRKIPIHTKLIELGFLEYLQKLKGEKSERLFPELKKINDKYGHEPGKYFKDMIRELMIKDVDKKSFHSLRHTFNDFFKKRNLQNAAFIQVFGHEQHILATRQYGSKFTPKQCFDDIISKLHYDGEEFLVKE